MKFKYLILLSFFTIFSQKIYAKNLVRFEPIFTYDMLSKMRKAGCVKMVFGLESVSPRVHKLMAKGNEVKVVERILRDTKQLGIVLRCI